MKNLDYPSSIARHSKSFTLAANLLPTSTRQATSIIYAWCRRADDAVDSDGKESQIDAVERLNRELDFVYSRRTPAHPLLEAFQAVTQRYRVPIEYPRALLKGLAMDVGRVAYPCEQHLLTYCFRVAGTVGLMMCHVLGAKNQRALWHAADLGIAMQITNICRDVVEDWQRGRLYLPHDRLRAVGLVDLHKALGEPFPETAKDRMMPVVRELLEKAELYYASGDAGLPALSMRHAFAVRSARLIYSEIGRRIKLQDYDVTRGRAIVPLQRKLRLVLLAATRTLREPRTPLNSSLAEEDSLPHVAGAFPL